MNRTKMTRVMLLALIICLLMTSSASAELFDPPPHDCYPLRSGWNKTTHKVGDACDFDNITCVFSEAGQVACFWRASRDEGTGE